MGRLLDRVSYRLAINLLLIILLSATGAWARPTTPEEAKNVVTNWLGLEARPLDAAMSPQVKEVRSFPGPDGATAYYVVFLQPRGLVIVAGDDLVEPIIGFLPAKKNYNPSQRNPLGALVSNDVSGRVLHARKEDAASLERGQPLASDNPMSQARRKWAQLAKPSISKGMEGYGQLWVSIVRVAPLIQTKWNQQTVCGLACYNYYTPPGVAGSADNYPSGCVATAMSQLMFYKEWPTQGVGTPSFTITVDGVSQTETLLGGDGAGGAYVWADMPAAPCSNSVPTTTQLEAIGALLHDAGAAVNMAYTADDSTATVTQSAAALTGTFQYSNAIGGHNSQWTNLESKRLKKMVLPNLDAQNPVIFGIWGKVDGGHAIVCDGYGYQAGTMYHHLNLGWGGDDNAWYNLPDISSGDCSFNTIFGCVYNVFETGSGEIISGRVVDDKGKAIKDAQVTATQTGGGSFTKTVSTDSKGIYALTKVPSASSYQVGVTKTGYTFPTKTASTGTSTTNSTPCGNVWNLNFRATAP
jgi:hypothetical protein